MRFFLSGKRHELFGANPFGCLTGATDRHERRYTAETSPPPSGTDPTAQSLGREQLARSKRVSHVEERADRLDAAEQGRALAHPALKL